jgi:integrase
VLYAVQQRAAGGTKLTTSDLRTFCDLLRSRQVAAMADLPTEGISRRHFWMRNTMLDAINRLTLTPESQFRRDVWDGAAFGHGGTIKFTGISQPWLREVVKRRTFEDLPKRRGDGVRSAVQRNVNSMALLSDSLRLQRDDGGDTLSAVGRADIAAFCNRLAYLQAQDTLTYTTRRKVCGQVKNLLDWVRTSGLTRRGQQLHRLPGDFALTRSDIPARPDDDTLADGDLSAEVLRQLCNALPALEALSCREVRVAVELMVDTGRRPDEICQLPWDCLVRDGDGKPVLIYDNINNQRLGRRLPIPEATAALINDQKTVVRQRYPHAPPGKLKLLPTGTANPHGTTAINDRAVSERHRVWVTGLPDLRLADGTVHDKAKVFPYAYRHTYVCPTPRRRRSPGRRAARIDEPQTARHHPEVLPLVGNNAAARPSTASR